MIRFHTINPDDNGSAQSEVELNINSQPNVKNVYMVQINTEYVGSVYLPYAIGSIAAYAWKNETVKKHYRLKPFIYRRSDIDTMVNSVENPFITAFSAYIWNFEFCKSCAKKIKEIYPDCIIVFGGHSTPETTEFLDNHSYIDYLIWGEGEEPFTELLCAIQDKKDLSGVSNIIYRNPEGTAAKSRARIITATDYPSPYLEGYFDEMVTKNPGTDFSMILETNRGCPYRCSYCDWGMRSSKVRQFPLNRVYSEIDWLSKNRIEYIFCADANFGIYSRDREISQKIIENRIKTGYPKIFHVNYTKNSNTAVFEINKSLNEYGMSKGATLSFQSFSPAVLKNIRRTNMSFDHFSGLMKQYNLNSIMTYSELILGLPGETYDSFKMALGKLLEAGQHTSIIVINFYLLVNSEISNPYYMTNFKIQTVPALLHKIHCAPSEEDEIAEYSQVVVSTATMSWDMWVKTQLLSFCVLCFHCFGLLQYFAIYLFCEKGIKYENFYEQLMSWLAEHPDTVSGKVFADIQQGIVRASRGSGPWFYTNRIFGNITWPFEEGMFLEMAYHSQQVYAELTDFLKDFNLEQTLFDELMNYQKNMLKLPGKSVFEFCSLYDFYNYFSGIYAGGKPALRSVKNIVRINDKSVPEKWDRYAIEVVWYGRRGGHILYNNIEQNYS